MSRLVLLLLSVYVGQARGCDYFLGGVVRHLHSSINTEKYIEFRKVFPKDYIISHHYNNSTLCDTDPCCVFRAAFLLSESWSQLLLNLWREHYTYESILDLKEKLDEIAEKRFLEPPDSSTLPPVSSRPQDLLYYTANIFSKWLEHMCPLAEGTCEFSTLTRLEEDESHEITHMRTTHAPYNNKHKRRWCKHGHLPTGGAISVHPSVCFLASLSVLAGSLF